MQVSSLVDSSKFKPLVVHGGSGQVYSSKPLPCTEKQPADTKKIEDFAQILEVAKKQR